jgi:DNA mismatch repair protein MutL
MSIQPLPIEVVHLIAAGEVIDSLAAVVRELAENALDAGATRLTIAVDPQQWRVRMADNGCGMTFADLQRAATPHSTSKIRDRQDLWQIASFGFRGEALYSLAQLGQLQIASRPLDADAGWATAYTAQGLAIGLDPLAMAPGTVVTVDQLFAQWPARRQALPRPAQQLRAIQQLVYRLALGHPQVAWQLLHGDRPWFNLFPAESSRHLLPQLVRDVQASDLQEFVTQLTFVVADEVSSGGRMNAGETDAGEPDAAQPKEGGNYLRVILGLPDRCHRRRPDWVGVMMNQRWVQQPELEQVILAAFRRTLPRDRYPLCIAQFQLHPALIDWNRHPAKSEIYLRQLEACAAQLTHAIEQALRLNPSTLPETLYSQRVGQVLKAAEAEASYGEIAGEEIAASPALPSSLQAIAQLHDRYIVAEHPTGIWLIEQHIAHERVLYERLCDRWEIAPLAEPVLLQQLLPAQVEQLQRLGIEIAPFGEQTWAARSAPAPLATRTDCADALVELSLGGDLQTAQVATACRSAIRNGTPLSLSDMQTLLDQWQQTRHPRTCPHGRPICLTLEESSLARFFRRHWVIGKSHGI